MINKEMVEKYGMCKLFINDFLVYFEDYRTVELIDITRELRMKIAKTPNGSLCIQYGPVKKDEVEALYLKDPVLRRMYINDMALDSFTFPCLSISLYKNRFNIYIKEVKQ